jgi:hypothetical protein
MRCHRLISLFLAGLLQLAVPVLASTYSTSVIGHDLNSNQVASVQTIVEAMQIELGRTTAPPPIYTPVTYAGTAGSTNTYPVLTNFYDPNNFAIGLASVTATNGTAWIDSSGTNLGYYNTNAITNSVAVVVTNWYGSAVTGQVVVALNNTPQPLIGVLTNNMGYDGGLLTASISNSTAYLATQNAGDLTWSNAWHYVTSGQQWTTNPMWIQYSFVSPHVFTTFIYSVRVVSNATHQQLSGSNDGTNFVPISVATVAATVTSTNVATSSLPYLYLRLNLIPDINFSGSIVNYVEGFSAYGY